MPENRSPQRPDDLLRPLTGRRAATTVGPDDPAVRDHLVHQVPVLPGVFLLDLVLRTVRRGGIDPGLVELRRIVFRAPVMGTGGRSTVEVGLGEAAEGQPLPVTVRSRPADDPQAPWETNCTAELHRADGRPTRHVDFAALVDTAPRTVAVDDLYGLVRGLDIEHRGFMRASGTVHVGSRHAVARMRLADEAVAHLGDFHAHPAVLDFATLVPMLLLDGHDADGPRPAYIPLYIESFRARTGVAAQNVVHVPGPVGGGLDSELFDADLEICSPTGEVVAELIGFRAKRVRSADLITDRARRPADRPDGAADPTPAAAAVGEGDFEDQVGALVARRLGVGADDVDRDLGFYECGLSSVDLLGIAADLEEILRVELYPTLLFEHPTVRRLAAHVRKEHPAATAPAQPASRPPAAQPAPRPPVTPAAALVPRDRSSHDDSARAEPLAVVGLAGRYPGARTPQQLWEVLAEGEDRATAVPADRWDHTAYFDARRGTPGRTYSRWGAFCEGVAEFDAGFFHFDDRQAELTDPHERLLLQTAWEAVEDAGHTPEGLAEQTGRAVGVFAGAMWNDYQLHGLDRLRAGTADIAGSWSSALSNRLSYAFDFAGPSLTVDTACSAGTAALHLAADAIRRGECRAALVGGVNLSLHPYKYLRLAELGLLSPTGRCRPFGRDADGYVPGEGVGVLLVRPLGDALASGDHVYGLVRGSALLHSGRTGGYSVPSPEAQARVVSAALADAGVSPRTIGYLEAHASGTPLGDQIEVEALTSVYSAASDDRGYCAIGSAKPVIGHLEAAAGIAGITKVLMALRHRTLPAAADVGDPHPSIHWETTPFRLPARAEPWAAPVDPADGSPLPRRAAVSAFGAGGANAHVIVEEFTAPDVPRPAGGRPLAVPVSARSASALREQAGRLAAHLSSGPDLELADVAHTLRAGRRAMAHRLAVVASTTAELADGLRAFAEGRPPGWPVHTGTVADGSDAGPARRGDEDDTARRWVTGSRIEWSVPEGARRVSLPTYPFERSRHWLGDTAQPGTAAVEVPPAASAGTPDGVRTLLYVPSTTPLPLPGRAAAPDGPLLVFDTDPDRTHELRALHPEVVTVRPGMSYQRTAPDTFEIEPGDAEQYHRLVATLRAEGRDPAAVLHLWALSAGDTTGSTAAGGVLSALLLCRALMTGRRHPLPVVYAYASRGTSPGHAAVGGLARSVRLEQPNLLLRAVRFTSGGADAATLWAEVCAPADARGTEIRHTDDGRFAEVFLPAGPFTGHGEPGPVLSRPGGVYLITGGAGGIGLHTARRIAATDGVRLALLGRSPENHRTAQAVAELRALGADALYLTADVTDRPALLTAVERIRERFGPLTGVVHAAGVLDDALLVNKTRASAERVLAPKTEGIAALDAVTGDDPLDYLLIHSSLASAVGSVGGADYSAANRALDAFASWREERRTAGARHGRTLAVDWPLWRDGGMRIDAGLQDRVLARTGSVPLDSRTALDTLDAALALGAERVVVLHGDPVRLTAALDTAPQADPAVDEPSASPVRAAAPSAGPDRRARVEASVEAMVTGALRRAGTEPPADWTRTGFMALGLTSLQLAGLTTELGTWLGAELPATTLLRYPDTDRLVGHLLDQHGPAASAASDMSVPDGPPADEDPETLDPTDPARMPVGPPAAVAGPRSARDPHPGAGPGHGEQPIAVIGMAGRFPGSRDTAGLWADLLAARDLVSPVPPERWDHSLFHDPEGRRVDATDCGHGGFLDDVTRFDAAFFGLTPAEAEGLDPQTRQLMEVLHETAEDAAVAPRLRGSATGTFVGRCFGDYDQAMTSAGRRMGAHDVTGTSVTMTANRAAYHFDLTGPSLVVDTACSSSLYALHLAVEAVRRGECDMAFAAGTNLILDPQHYVRSSALGALSPSGRCHTFDARADGYVPAEAVVAVLIKPLDRALADGDPVHAVIRAVGVNHGGRAGSVTAPNPARQTQLLLDTWARAGVDPAHIGYLEAHGTGTALGDPVEIEGAVAAFRRHTTASAFCAVGSAKAHLGHAEGAAGLVGLVKAVLQTRHGVIPAMPGYSRPSPHISLDGSPLHIPARPFDWRAPAGRRRLAGVSSFGFGGSYAHAVIEQAPGRPMPAATDEPRLFPFSARDHRYLRQLVRRHRDFLAEAPRTPLAGLAATLHHGREPMPHRVALVAASAHGLLSAMDEYLAGQDSVNAVYVTAPDHAVGPRLREAARIWADGGAVPDDVSPAPGTVRVHLPVHPFAGTRYWFGGTDAPFAEALPMALPEAGAAPEVPEVAEVRRHVLASGFSGRHARMGLDRLDDLLRRWCARLLGEGGSPLTAERLRGLLHDEERYGRLADALVAMSARLPGPVGPADFPGEMAALRTEHPELAPWLDLVTVCLPRLPDILAGRADALEVFFSSDHPDLLLRVYDGNTVADHHNEIVARLVAARARNLRASRPDRPVRVLEIGGGTGGTTRRLLEALAEHGTGVLYQFTDVSPAFLPAARTRFDGTPVEFSCAVLDLDRDPVEQGFAPGGVDIVVAANSVHASRHLGESLARVRGLLAPGGVLVLEELVRNHDCMAAMIGPLPGYWSAVDAQARLPHSPFFDVPRWRAALAEQGFEGTWALGAPDLSETEFDNAVLYSQVPSTVPAHLSVRTPHVSDPAPAPAPPVLAVPAPAASPNAAADADADEIRERLRPVFAGFFGLEPGEVDTAAPFDRYGMDSLSAIQLVRSLEPEFGRLPKVLLYEHTSIDSLAAHLAVHAPVPSNIEPAPAAPVPSAVARSAASRRTWTKDEAPDDPVAIVGMAGRFARSPDLRTWWRRLRDGEHLVDEIPADRFDWREVFGDPHRTPGTVNSRWGSFIDGVDEFDADFFGMTPLEAELMDPQQRLMLQTAWHAVEDAGHRPADLRGSRTGVFVGATSHDYDWQLQRAGRHREGHVVSGNGHCLIANRVSYQMDLRGPSEAVDTACSSSLTALHRAVRAVRSGECEAALVGGVHLFLTADLFVALGQLGIVSPDGRCAAFDRGANGMVRGEASVAVLVKPLSQALADGDTVYALVRGSGVSHGGGGHMDSLMMPNPTAQAELIASVYRDAGVAPRTVTYVEAHGTGTEVGDPIEVRGLRKAFATLDGRTDAEEVEPWCLLGTVKSNVGHTEAAAGLTGVVKTVLAMRHALVPPTLHFTEPNPLLDLDGGPFRVADRLTPWPAHDGPRRAGVSAFGLGGTNAHILLEDFPETRPAAVPAAARSAFVVPLSARTPERLRAQVETLYAALTGPEDLPEVADIAHTLTVGRDEMARRAAFTVASTEELVEVLRRTIDGETDPRAFIGDAADASATARAADSPADAAQAARRWTAGTAPLRPAPGRRVSLPGYAFEAQRHWAEPLEPDGPSPAAVPPAGDSLPGLLQALNEGRLTVDQAEQLMEGVR